MTPSNASNHAHGTTTDPKRRKIEKPCYVETVGFNGETKRLHVRDRETGMIFLVDTGLDISILLVKTDSNTKATALVLFAANNS